MILSNIYEITPGERDFPVQVVPFSKEALDTLRREHNRAYSFFRHEDEIFAIWIEGSRIALGKERRVRWADSPEICQSACRHLLFRTFVRKLPGLKPLDFTPLRFLSRKENHDVIRDKLPSELQDVAFYKRLNEINVIRVMRGRDNVIGVTINIDHFWGLTLNGAEMIASGFDLRGRLISEVKPVPGLAGC